MDNAILSNLELQYKPAARRDLATTKIDLRSIWEDGIGLAYKINEEVVEVDEPFVYHSLYSYIYFQTKQ